MDKSLVIFVDLDKVSYVNYSKLINKNNNRLIIDKDLMFEMLDFSINNKVDFLDYLDKRGIIENGKIKMSFLMNNDLYLKLADNFPKAIIKSKSTFVSGLISFYYNKQELTN